MRRLVLIMCFLICVWQEAPAKDRVNVEYSPLVKEVYLPKADDAEIGLVKGDPERPHKKIGVVTAAGEGMNVSRAELDRRVKETAREVGADAVINIHYSDVETPLGERPADPDTYEHTGTSFSKGTMAVRKPICQGIMVRFTDR